MILLILWAQYSEFLNQCCFLWINPDSPTSFYFMSTVLFSFLTRQLLLKYNPVCLLVAGAVADINRIVAEEDSKNTLLALQVPSAGLRAVLSECADTYQAELGQRQKDSATKGSLNNCTCTQKTSSVFQTLRSHLIFGLVFHMSNVYCV